MQQNEINSYMNSISKRKLSQSQRDLIRGDLEAGASKDLVDAYVGKNFDYPKMSVISSALRDQVSDGAVRFLINTSASTEHLKAAVQKLKEGVSLEIVSDALTGNISVSEYKDLIDTKVAEEERKEEEKKQAVENEKKSKLEKEKKEIDIADQLDSVMKKLEVQSDAYTEIKNQLSDMTTSQKKEDHETIARLRNELDVVKEEREKLRAQLEDIKAQIQKRDEELAKEVQAKEELEKENVEEKMDMDLNIPVKNSLGSGKYYLPVEHQVKSQSNSFVSIFSKVLGKPKSRKRLVKLIVDAGLNPEQLVQIRNGLQKGLLEEQLEYMIVNKVAADRMSGIIEVAVLEKALG